MTTIRRSLAYTIADSYLALPLQIIGTMIISRILSPSELGIFAVAAAFAALASNFRDFGVAEYLIQEKELREEHIRASLTANIILSWTMGVLLFSFAPFAADFYRAQGVGEVMRVQAFNFLLIPFGAVTMAYFRRLLDFRPIFIASLLSNITTFIVATLCALQGQGYMSLAWSSLAGVMVTVGTSLWFRPKDFPRWPGLSGIGAVVNFGKFASGIYLLGQLGKGAPEMIIGRAQDMVGVAIFSRASGLVEIFHKTVLKALNPVCLPYFAKSNREKGTIIDGYLISISYLTVIGWPFLLFVGITAYSAIRIVYGPQWTASVPLAQILCAVGAIELVHYLAKEALIAVGDVRRSTLLQTGIQGSRIVGLLVVIPFGLAGACWGLFVASVFGMVFSQKNLAIAIGLRTSEVAKICRISLYIAIFSSAPVALWVCFEAISEENFLRFAIVGGVLTVSIWLFSLRFFTHPLWGEVTGLMSKIASRIRAR